MRSPRRLATTATGCEAGGMTPVAKITVSLASLVLLAGMTACAPTAQTVPADEPAAVTTPEPTASPEPTRWPLPADQIVSELPAWATEVDMLWIVYPDGFQCTGSEGCPNDFRSLIGTPSDPLPDGVAYYDPECMDGRYVWPLEQSEYMTEGNGMRLDGPAVSAPDVPPVTCS